VRPNLALTHLPAGITPETMIFAGEELLAFEGVSPGANQADIAKLAEAVRARFDMIRMWRFRNEIGAVSYFWQAWKTGLRVDGWSFDGKVSRAILPLDEPPWEQFRAPHSQYAYSISHKE